ncbi:MAG: FkbM family methyltransferase [Bacteroidetes bacterium]|nr:FkbM family methyltransferase [Bacteroidota bacterium]
MKKVLKKTFQTLPFKKEIFLFLRIFKLPHAIYKHLYFKGNFQVNINSKKLLINHYGFELENEIFWRGLENGWENISMRLWIELSKQSEVIFDIGANTGIYSLVSKTVNQNVKVYAFEPVKRVYEKLCANNALNNFDINCFELAISNQNGEAVIYDTPTDHVYSVAVNKNIADVKNPIITKIKTETLHSFIRQHNITKIDLMKIDVETHEPEVLEGMQEFLQQYKPTLLIEILNDEVATKVESLIKHLDYLFFNIDEINKPKQVSKIDKSDFHNYLFCSEKTAKYLNIIS